MNGKKKNSEKWIVYYVLSVIAFVLFVSIFFAFLDFINFRDYFKLKFSDNYDWLNFYGSIIGGVLGGITTMIGIYYTLKADRKNYNDNQRLNVKPLFEYKSNSENLNIVKCGFSIDNNYNEYNEKDIIKWPINLFIKNIGLGHAQNIEIEVEIDNNKLPGTFSSFSSTSILKVGEMHEEHLYFFKNKQSLEKINKENYNSYFFSHNIFLTIHYKDLLYNQYSQRIQLIVSGHIEYNDISSEFIEHYDSELACINVSELFEE